MTTPLSKFSLHGVGLWGVIIASAVLVVPIATYLNNRSIVPLVALVAVLGLVICYRRGNPVVPDKWVLPVVFAVLTIWVLVSAIWALDTDRALLGSAKIVGGALVGIFLLRLITNLDERESDLIGRALVGGTGFCAILIVIDSLAGGPISVSLLGWPDRGIGRYFWLNAPVALLVLMVWPAIAYLLGRQQPWLVIGLVVVVLVSPVGVGFQSGFVGLLGGLIAAAAYYWFRKPTVWIMAATLIVGIMMAPWISEFLLDPEFISRAPDAFPNPLIHRFYIWDFVTDRILEHPLRGWGMDASRAMPGREAMIMEPVRQFGAVLLPLHPHNGTLQIWLELGVPGAILLAILCVAVLVWITRAPISRTAQALAFGQFVTVLLMANVSYGIWRSTWISSIWFGAALMVIIASRSQSVVPGSAKPSRD